MMYKIGLYAERLGNCGCPRPKVWAGSCPLNSSWMAESHGQETQEYQPEKQSRNAPRRRMPVRSSASAGRNDAWKEAQKHLLAEQFTVDAALLQELGERLIGRAHIALAELVKISCDADAHTVRVDVERDRIVVSDHEHGTSNEEFINFWMRIETTHKVKSRRSRKLRRSMTGSKDEACSLFRGFRSDSSQAVLRVSDSGGGLMVPLSEAGTLFEACERRTLTSPANRSVAKGGLGLGMAFVRMIARSRGADLEIVSPTPGFSTTLQHSWKGQQ